MTIISEFVSKRKSGMMTKPEKLCVCVVCVCVFPWKGPALSFCLALFHHSKRVKISSRMEEGGVIGRLLQKMT